MGGGKGGPAINAVPASPAAMAQMVALEVLELSSALISSMHDSKWRWRRVSSALFTIFRSRFNRSIPFPAELFSWARSSRTQPKLS